MYYGWHDGLEADLGLRRLGLMLQRTFVDLVTDSSYLFIYRPSAWLETVPCSSPLEASSQKPAKRQSCSLSLATLLLYTSTHSTTVPVPAAENAYSEVIPSPWPAQPRLSRIYLRRTLSE